MKNDIFDFCRFWRYLKRVLSEVQVKLLAIAYVVIAICCVVAAVDNSYAFIPCFAAITTVMLVCAFGFLALFTMSKSLMEMLIPASVVEKYLARLLVYFAIPCMVSLAVVVMFDSVPFVEMLYMLALCSLVWLFSISAGPAACGILGCMSVYLKTLPTVEGHLGGSLTWVLAAVIVANIVGGYLLLKKKNYTANSITLYKQ